MAAPPTTQLRAEQAVVGEETDGGEGTAATKKRYRIILRIRHPELDPAEITAALGWEPQHSWKRGDQAMTPKGTRLPHLRPDGLWSCSFRYQGDAKIAEKLDQVLAHLSKHDALFRNLNEMDAKTALYVQLPGDTNIGDRLPWEVLKKFADLQIAFEFETFPEWR
jgi:hypothetical protein